MWDAFVGFFINVLLLIYQFVGNFGVAIILFTILIRLITHPLMVSQIKGAQGMQNLQKDKRWIDVQTKYKGDKEKLAAEQMRLYKELNINPFASCLPTLIQLPIIFALYQALIRAMASTPMELLSLTRHVYSDVLSISTIIPLQSRFLWMDLSQPERLNIPGLGFGIPVLAIVVVVSTYVQSKLMQPPASGPGDQTAMMSNMMNLYMPFLMGWMAYSLASGLALYFLISNLAGIGQYAMLGKVNWSNLLPRRTPPAPVRGKPQARLDRPAPAAEEKKVKAAAGAGKSAKNLQYSRQGKPGKLAKVDKTRLEDDDTSPDVELPEETQSGPNGKSPKSPHKK